MPHKEFLAVRTFALFVLFCAFGLPSLVEAQSLGAAQKMLSANGVCDPVSHTAEGPLGSDLTKTDVPFKCDAVVISNFANDQNWVLVQFSKKESLTSNVLGFSGEMDSSGAHFPIRHIYFQTGEPMKADAGSCDIFFKGNNMTGITCVGKVDEDGRRAVALVSFQFIPEQAPPGQ